MFAEVARDEPQPQGALWVAIAAEGPPGALERRRVTPVPLGMQNGKPLGRDARQVLLARKRITVEPRIVEPKLDRPPGMAAGFVHPALFPQDGCQIRLDLRQVGPQGQRLPQGGLGLRQAALHFKAIPRLLWASASCPSKAMARWQAASASFHRLCVLSTLPRLLWAWAKSGCPLAA